jgi:hypothetical protein
LPQDPWHCHPHPTTTPQRQIPGRITPKKHPGSTSHPRSTSHLFLHIPHQHALNPSTSAQTSGSIQLPPRPQVSPFFTYPSLASTSHTHLCTNLRQHPAPTREAPLTFFHIYLTNMHLTQAPLHKPLINQPVSANTSHQTTTQPATCEKR